MRRSETWYGCRRRSVRHDPDKPVANPDDIETAFSRCAAVFKSGVQVVQDGEIVSNGHKRTLWVNVAVKENPQVMRDINEKFVKYANTV